MRREIMTDQEIELLLNQALKDMFYSVLRLQEKSVSKLAKGNISRTEMHTLEIVQDIPDATLTQITDILGITKATVSVSVNRLVEKGYLIKNRAEDDKRKNILQLTEEGEIMCKKHAQFHDMLIQAVVRDFQVSQYPEVLKSMQALVNFFNHLRV
jgi:DNA-binding MarR family transcriptional regulator